jgi:hypothetical protein
MSDLCHTLWGVISDGLVGLLTQSMSGKRDCHSALKLLKGCLLLGRTGDNPW